MANVRPLTLRIVRPAWAERVASPAHDALTPADRRAHMAFNPDSYLAVTRGLEDALPEESLTAGDLLQQGRAALDRLRQNGAFGSERDAQFYVYQLDDGQRSLTGVVGGVAVDDYSEGVVRIHEHVKAQRAIHLANHLDVVGVQSSPIAMAHPPLEIVDEIVAATTSSEPMLDVGLDDGLTQRIWPIDPERTETISAAFADAALYLIDGHHRAAAAATFRAASGSSTSNWMLSALFPSDQLENAPHHRVLHLTGGPSETLRKIGRHRRLRQVEREEVETRADDEIALYGLEQWYLVTIDEGDEAAGTGTTDPERFQHQILAPLFHLDPESDSPAISYLAGHRSLDDLESVIDAEGGLLVLMRRVPIDALLEAADRGHVMPPKSTYFEPKVRSGLFIRQTSA